MNINYTHSILEQLDQMKAGDHNILICPDLDTLREICSHYCETRLEKNEIVLLLVNHESIQPIMNYLAENGVEIKKYRKDGSLIIVNSVERFFGSGADFLSFLDIVGKQITKKGKKGISLIADMGPFSHLDNVKHKIIDCETFITKTSDIQPASLLCGYHARDLKTLTSDEMEILFEQHHKKIIIDSNQY
jgi:MEDS: MEthanogen/methylotroph, DcmR Sensory domain